MVITVNVLVCRNVSIFLSRDFSLFLTTKVVLLKYIFLFNECDFENGKCGNVWEMCVVSSSHQLWKGKVNPFSRYFLLINWILLDFILVRIPFTIGSNIIPLRFLYVIYETRARETIIEKSIFRRYSIYIA